MVAINFKTKRKYYVIAVVIVAICVIFLLLYFKDQLSKSRNSGPSSVAPVASLDKNNHDNKPGVSASATYIESFIGNSILEEVGSIGESTSSSWWVNSGAYLYYKDGYARTIQGSLISNDKWRIKFNLNNPAETDNGYHPQNIFRLVQSGYWGNYTQQSYYRINKYILSPAKERSASNGQLLFNRYQDGNNLYYTGIRVDGTAVIKKKQAGTYYTMAQTKIFPGIYNRDTNPNLLPLNKWLGVRSIVKNNDAGGVSIVLYVDKNGDGNWVKVLETTDTGMNFGGPAITQAGHTGIRTDFMDVEFKDYNITEEAK
jgi:hypothetical protein